ncbi:MAG: SPOR domain-containing protein [Sulfurifustis sp.]
MKTIKWVAAALVLANLAFLMWGLWYHQPLVGPNGPRPPVDVSADKMRLLSEPGVRLSPRARNGSPAHAETVAASAVVNCYRLGPFAALERARAAGAKLEGWGLSYERIVETESIGEAYRVVTRPFPSREAAERRRREITALGFTDNALLQEEGLANAISLGIFALEQNARAHVLELAHKGVPAMIQRIPNVRPVYWLKIAEQDVGDEPGRVTPARFAAEDWGTPNMRLQAATCRTASPSAR